MARILIVGGGCRGRNLAGELVVSGHAVRATTRTEAGRPAIEATGAECFIGDPDRIGSLRYALDGVAVLLWALATATGDPERVRALHDSRLQMMLTNVIDSTIRGLVYEAAGGREGALLAAGAEQVRRAALRSEIPFEIVSVSPADTPAWTAGTRRAIERLLAG